MIPLDLWQTLGTVLGPTGAAWIAVKASLNGTKADVKEIKADVKEIRGTQMQHGQDIAVLKASHIDRKVEAD